MNNVMGGIAEALVATAIASWSRFGGRGLQRVRQKVGDLEDNVQTIGAQILAQMKSHKLRAPRVENGAQSTASA